MMPGFGTNSTMGSTSVPARVEYNISNDLSSEYIYEQGLSYPATNGCAYYTGFEAPVEWSEHTNFFGVEGQNLQVSNDNLPYLYCTPGYGFSYSSPDQYTYMPSMFMGVDGSLIGSQQYFTSPYQPPGSPSGYFPVFIQPTTDFNSAVSLEPPLFSTGTSVASRPANTSIKIKHQMSGNITMSSQTVPSGSPTTGPSQRAYQSQSTNKPSDPANANVTRCDKPATSHFTIPVDASLANKDGKSDEGNQLKDHVPPAWVSSFQNLQVTSGAWTSGDKGPRTNSPGIASVATTTGEGGQTKAVSSTSLENIVIHPGQYNKDDFPVDHPDAKFFVIKSYSEDDVHKSIKYNVWSSTPNGNRRLDAAYSDAQGRTPGNCPIFLFFSVNTSGQFCGVAEMVGPLDFHKDMDFWQQDKWSGSFPVKWHLIKDVSNSTFRHIVLENNENKPVTNSRDTQEIPYKWGINMLKLFKNSPMTTSILDDFPFYEGRQNAMLEEKRRRLGRSFDGLVYVPAFIAKSNVGVDGEPSEVGKGRIKDSHSGKTGQDCDAFEQPEVNQTKDGVATQVPKKDGVTLIEKPEHIADRDNFDVRVDQEIGNCSASAPPENSGRKPADLSELVKVNGMVYNDNKAQSEMNSQESNCSSGKKYLSQKFGGHNPSGCMNDGAAGILEDKKSTKFLTKPQAFPTGRVDGEVKGSANEMSRIIPTGVVKVGSVHIKVNVAGESSSEIYM